MSLAIDQASHDDMREQLARAEADAERLTAENARLRTALKNIADQKNSDRYTVTPETAFEEFGKINRKVCAIYDTARAALDSQQKPAVTGETK